MLLQPQQLTRLGVRRNPEGRILSRHALQDFAEAVLVDAPVATHEVIG